MIVVLLKKIYENSTDIYNVFLRFHEFFSYTNIYVQICLVFTSLKVIYLGRGQVREIMHYYL